MLTFTITAELRHHPECRTGHRRDECDASDSRTAGTGALPCPT
jgi:hypothetical protein